MADVTKEEIKRFWDGKAEELGDSPSATLGEVGLRTLEIRTMLKFLRRRRPSLVLEVGCGNGHSTAAYATAFPAMRIMATDYSEKMIEAARTRPSNANVSYEVWDLTKPEEYPYQERKFDLIFSQRVIQNLPTREMQKDAIEQLLSMLSVGGVLCLMECSRPGVDQLNSWRRRVGKQPIEGIIPWHNKFFEDELLKREFASRLSRIVYFSSTYMFITRILTNMRAQRYASRLPAIGRFGYDRMYLFKA